jgi:transcription elongation factor GreA
MQNHLKTRGRSTHQVYPNLGQKAIFTALGADRRACNWLTLKRIKRDAVGFAEARPGETPSDGTVRWFRRFIIAPSMTEHIKRKLQEEMNALEHELVHELPKEIKKAAALGDLSENAEYHMAKQRQEFVKARLRQLGARMADLALINMDNIPRDKVGLGSTVKVFDNTKNEEVEYKLVTSEETDVASGKISTSSPIGRALLNKKVGETASFVTPNGKREMEILSLSTIHDEAAAK